MKKHWSKIVTAALLLLMAQSLVFGTVTTPKIGMLYSTTTQSENDTSHYTNMGMIIGGCSGGVVGGLIGFLVGTPSGPGAAATSAAGAWFGIKTGTCLGATLGAF